MIKLRKSESLKRDIRQDDIEDLAIPTWELAKQAIKTNKLDDAIKYINYTAFEAKQMHDILADFPDVALTYIAESCGEGEIIKVLRQRYFDRAKAFVSTIKGPREALERLVEQQRAHFSNFSVHEEKDRYVVCADPCGSGGRLRRIKNVETIEEYLYKSLGKNLSFTKMVEYAPAIKIIVTVGQNSSTGIVFGLSFRSQNSTYATTIGSDKNEKRIKILPISCIFPAANSI